MAITYDQAVATKNRLRNDYEEEHSDFRRLRELWHGKYWESAQSRSPSVSSIFKDITSRGSEVGPDIKLTYNLLKDICVKFQTFLSTTPMIQMYVDPPSSPTRRNQAMLKERFLYGTWGENKMNQILADNGWYLPLMGNSFLGAYPDMEKNIVRAILRSPEHAYPVPSFDYGRMDAIIFSFEATESAVRRTYPGYVSRPQKGRRPSDPKVEILEWSDDNCFYRWIDGQYVQGTEHNFGFNLFDHIKFINVPGESFGEGAVKQSANLVEMGNAYLSLMMQSAIENVFPVMVLEDAMKAPEVIQRGAGAVIPVNAGGKVYYLQPPAGNLLAQSDWAQRIQQMVQTDSSMPDVNFGNADNSIITGKAINELQGAGTGSLVEMVQGCGIGAALCSFNEKAIHITRTMFADESIHLFGQLAGSIADLNPKQFALNLKGSQLTGSTRNEVVFMPHMDMHTKVVIGLQLAGAGIVSRTWQRNQVGIPDSEAMDDEIVSETIQDAALQLLVQTITAPEDTAEVEAQAHGIIAGQVRAGAPQAPSPLGGGAPGGVAAAPGGGGLPPPPGGGGGGMPVEDLAGGGQAMFPAFPLPPGSPLPEDQQGMAGGAPPMAAGPQEQGTTLQSAVQAFQGLQGAKGQIFLIGEIVVEGSAAEMVEVAINDAADRGLVSQVGFPTSVKVIRGTPNEEYIEVTPGASPTPGGMAPSPEDLGGGL